MSEKYIPSARDAVIARFGRNSARYLRTHCNTCLDEHQLTDASPVYGDLYVADEGAASSHGQCRLDEAEQCDICGVLLIDLSRQCQREHDEQQARWSRQPVAALVEYGIPAAIRCRVY